MLPQSCNFGFIPHIRPYIQKGKCKFSSNLTNITKDSKMHLLEVSNPVALQRGVLNATKASNRPESLDNKTVGLIWSGTHGGDIALKRAGEMLQERFENVSVNFYTGGNYPTPPAIVKQAGEECDVIIGATAD